MAAAEPQVSDAGLSIRGLSKRFGGLRVFDDVSFDLRAGQILGVVGPNGAGKTTLINVVCGLLSASAGEVWLDGRSIGGEPFHAVSRLGVLRSFQQTNTFKSASVEENLYRARRFTAGRAGPDLDIDALVEEYGLSGHLDDRSDSLPYGLQKMLGLLMVLVARPRILLLDEPAAGLERKERTQIDRFVEYARKALNCGVLIVEHDMELVRRLCPEIIVLEAGRLLASGPPDEVLARGDVRAAYLGVSED